MIADAPQDYGRGTQRRETQHPHDWTSKNERRPLSPLDEPRFPLRLRIAITLVRL